MLANYSDFSEPRPPSTPRVCPVMNQLSGWRRKAMALATSAASPKRFNGWSHEWEEARENLLIKVIAFKIHHDEHLTLNFYTCIMT